MPRKPAKAVSVGIASDSVSGKATADTKVTVDRMKAPHAEAHGFLGSPDWVAPRRVTVCAEVARPGYATVAAHEYLDDDDVLEGKIQLLCDMIRRSKAMVAYTGAGISTASGIRDYATKAAGSVTGAPGPIKSGLSAQPTLAHRVLVGLYGAGYLKHWVQQNHDGLPQKAGFPMSDLNEIHGAWFDPSNPVVKFSGSLRDDLMDWLVEWEEKADLSLVLGTSLSGMNADRMAITPGEKAARMLRKGVPQNEVCGTVIINIQKTKADDIASLRIFAPIDRVMERVARALKVQPTTGKYRPPHVSVQSLKANTFSSVLYDAAGQRVEGGGAGGGMVLNLSKGQRVRVTHGSPKGVTGEVLGQNEEGHYRIRFDLGKGSSIVRAMGLWWLEVMATGSLPMMPVVNV